MKLKQKLISNYCQAKFTFIMLQVELLLGYTQHRLEFNLNDYLIKIYILDLIQKTKQLCYCHLEVVVLRLQLTLTDNVY